MLETPSLSIESLRKLRIIILPASNLDSSKFLDYCNQIIEVDCIDLSGKDPITNTQYLHQDYKNKKLYINYVVDNIIKDSLISNTPNKNSTNCNIIVNDYEYLQGYKRILGIIVIMDANKTNFNFKSECIDFQQKIKNDFPEVQAIKFFVFNSNEQSSKDSKDEAVFLPPDTNNEKLIKISLTQYSYKVLSSVERAVNRDIPTEAPFLSSPLDSAELEKTTILKSLIKKQTNRIGKWRGDYCLLATSFKDAIDHYTLAIERCRVANDVVWQAGSLEGLCAAMFFNSAEKTFDNEIVTKYNEAISLYTKVKALVLGAEACLKFASYYIYFDMKTEASQVLCTCSEFASSLTGQEKILFLNNIAYQYYKIGFYRKFAYFMLQTSTIYDQFQLKSTQQHILLLIAKYFQIYNLDYPKINSSSLNDKYGWYDIQYHILKTLRECSVSLNDNVNTAIYIVYMLRTLLPKINVSEQKRLAKDLFEATLNSIGNISTDMIGIPKLVKLEVQKLEGIVEVPKQQPIENEGGNKREVFLHNPLIKKNVVKTGPSIWIKNQISKVTVTLHNPFSFKIPIQSISLILEGAKFHPHMSVVNLAPNSKTNVELSVLPLEEGELKIKGCKIKSFNIHCDHPINEDGTFATSFSAASEFSKKLKADQRKVDIKVIDPQPTLHISSNLFSGGSLTILEGSMDKVNIDIVNISQIPVDSISLHVEERVSITPNLWDKKTQVFSWKSDTQTNQIIDEVLLPGKRFKLSVDVFGLVGAISSTFIFTFGNSNCDYRNTISLTIPIYIKHVLQLEKFDIVNGHDIDQFPKEYAIKGEEEQKNGKNFDRCLLVFQIFNSTEDYFEINPVIDNKEMVSKEKCILSPSSSQRICVPLSRFYIPLDKIEGPPVDPNKQFIKIDDKLKPNEAKVYLEKLIYSYKKDLLNRIQLNWKSSHMETGFISLSSLTLSYDKILRIMPPQLLVDYRLDEQFKEQDLNTYIVPLHTPISISLEITNNKLTPVSNIKVSFDELVKDTLNENSTYQSFMFTDRLYGFIDKLESREKKTLKFSIFLAENRNFVFVANAQSVGLPMNHTKIKPIYFNIENKVMKN